VKDVSQAPKTGWGMEAFLPGIFSNVYTQRRHFLQFEIKNIRKNYSKYSF